LKALRTGPSLIQLAPEPETSRETFLRVFEGVVAVDWDRVGEEQAALRGDEQKLFKSDEPRKQDIESLAKRRENLDRMTKPWGDFIDLLWGGKPTERDALAVLKPEDIPLLRKVRRAALRGYHQHAIERYNNLSHLLMSLVWKPELVR